MSQNLPYIFLSGSTSDGRLLDTDTSPSSSPQESPNTFINGRSTESLSSLVSDDPRPPPRRVSIRILLYAPTVYGRLSVQGM